MPKDDPTYVEDHGTATECPDSPTGKHEIDFHSVTQADVDPSEMIMDVNCKACGRSGAFCIPTEIDW